MKLTYDSLGGSESLTRDLKGKELGREGEIVLLELDLGHIRR